MHVSRVLLLSSHAKIHKAGSVPSCVPATCSGSIKVYARTVLEMNETNAPFAAFESAAKVSLNVIGLVGQNKP